MSERFQTNQTSPPAIDTDNRALYNEADVRRIAEESAELAITKVLHTYPFGIVKLDNCTETNSVSSDNNGGTDMSNRMKAKVIINGETKWVTGESAQKLVDNAVKATSFVPSNAPTFREYAKAFFKLYKSNGSIEHNTLVGYKSYLNNHILPFFGDRPIDTITTDDIQRYINLKAADYTRKTIREHINLLRPIFEAALDEDLIQKNPCTSPRLNIIGKKSEKVLAYSEEEYKQLEGLIPKLNEPDQLFLALSLYTGMRQGELFALRWENIDLDARTLQVTHSVEWPSRNKGILKQPKTANGIRTIILIPQLQTILAKYKKESGFVLTSSHQEEEQPMTQQAVKCMKARVQKAAKANGIDFPFLTHRSRHTVATFMNNAGADDVSITGTIGHSDVAFTKRQYTNHQIPQLQRGMERFSHYISDL